MNIFDRATKAVNDTEDSFLNLVSVVVSWGVPLIPAYITYQHMIAQLHFPVWIAWVAGAVVEGLGLSTMNTFFKFWKHNQRYAKSPQNQFSIWVPIGAYIWYLAIVLLVNVVFDWVSGVAWYNVLAVALFSTLSLPAAALISVRTLYTEWQKERAQSKSERPGKHGRARGEHSERGEQNDPALLDKTERPEHASDYAEQIESILERKWQATGRVPGGAEIVRALNEEHGAHLDRAKASGYIATLTKNWKTSKGIKEDAASSNGRH
jgi:hypothetical protein